MTDDLTTRYDGVLERTPDGGVIRFERHLARAHHAGSGLAAPVAAS